MQSLKKQQGVKFLHEKKSTIPKVLAMAGK